MSSTEALQMAAAEVSHVLLVGLLYLRVSTADCEYQWSQTYDGGRCDDTEHGYYANSFRPAHVLNSAGVTATRAMSAQQRARKW
jgi:hypothetical protein